MPALHLSTTELNLLAAVIGYLVGSIPFGLILAKLTGAGDLRAIGSGSIGATNVLRTGRKGVALATLVLDAGKGAVLVLAASPMHIDLAAIAGLAAVLGHNFPVWLKFRGGKGVATSLGVLVAISWPVGLVACGAWFAVAAITRYSSLAGLVALTAAPVAAWWLANPRVVQLAAVLAILGVIRHQANIRRLLTGQESRIGGRKAGDADRE